MRAWRSKSVRGMPSRRACAAVPAEVGMAAMRRPVAMRSARDSSAKAAVEPLPSPTTMPSFTSATARAAAARFIRSCGDSATAISARGAGLDVAAELVAHGRQELLGEAVLLARAEAGVERGRQHLGRHRLLDGGQHRPAALAGILH